MKNARSPCGKSASSYKKLKRKLAQKAGSGQPYEEVVQLKLTATDGKQRETDCAKTATLLRIVQSIPSPKAEPIISRRLETTA